MTTAMPAAIHDYDQVHHHHHSPAHSIAGSISPPSQFAGSFPITTPSLQIFEMDPKLVPKARKSGGGNKKGTSAERRATHNAVERARRESLNVRFLELAAALPSTAGVRRPSKNLIVKKSLAFVADALAREDMYRARIADMAREGDAMREELNALRQRDGLPPIAPRVDMELPPPMTDAAPAGPRHRNDSTASIGNGVGELGFGNDDYDDDGSAGSDGGLAGHGGESPYGGQHPAYTHGAPQPFAQLHHYVNHRSVTAARGVPLPPPPPPHHESPYGGPEPVYTTYAKEETPGPAWGPSYGGHLDESYSPPPASHHSVPSGSVGAAHGGPPSYHEMPPITPTTAMIFNNVLASLEIPGEASPPQHYEASPPHHGH